MSELIERLCRGESKIKLNRYPSIDDVKQCISRKFILVNFYQTNGGTELGIQLDPTRSKVEVVDFEQGQINIVGELTLNYQRMRCHAEIKLDTLDGIGHLEII